MCVVTSSTHCTLHTRKFTNTQGQTGTLKHSLGKSSSSSRLTQSMELVNKWLIAPWTRIFINTRQRNSFAYVLVEVFPRYSEEAIKKRDTLRSWRRGRKMVCSGRNGMMGIINCVRKHVALKDMFTVSYLFDLLLLLGSFWHLKLKWPRNSWELPGPGLMGFILLQFLPGWTDKWTHRSYSHLIIFISTSSSALSLHVLRSSTVSSTSCTTCDMG